jgi:hypothetical protein
VPSTDAGKHGAAKPLHDQKLYLSQLVGKIFRKQSEFNSLTAKYQLAQFYRPQKVQKLVF